ncbi:MAG: ABC transporter permease, partial [Clostridiales bacterium]|nr:ABC transporter permease [Clostridiales bacterium]
MIFWENLMLAFTAIRANKLRSFLTMLGMIIGISSVITIVSLGDTMRGLMASEYENIGLGAVVLYITPENAYYTESEMFSTYDRDRVREAMGDALLYA